MVPDPIFPYAATNMTGEHYCRTFTEQYGLKTLCLRYFNVFGPRQDPKSEYAAVIPLFINRLLEKKEVTIFGNGDQTRDFIYVKDVVDAVKCGIKNDVSGVFNIALGKSTSVKTLFRIIQESIGSNAKPEFHPARPGDVQDSYADISHVKTELGFVPKYTLEEAIEETVRWYKESYYNI
jgi:nucleoside-diphosphate-sugar epimerase